LQDIGGDARRKGIEAWMLDATTGTALAANLKVRTLLSLGYGCGLRASEVVRLKVKHIDSAQKIIRIEQSKGRKDRNVMLSPETLGRFPSSRLAGRDNSPR
jgi:integrase